MTLPREAGINQIQRITGGAQIFDSSFGFKFFQNQIARIRYHRSHH